MSDIPLWRVQRDDRLVGYDEYVAWIVAHHSAEQAINSVYFHEAGIKATQIGVALPDATEGQVLLDSFNAG